MAGVAGRDVRSVPFDTVARLDDIVEPEKGKKTGRKREEKKGREKGRRPRPVALQRVSRWGGRWANGETEREERRERSGKDEGKRRKGGGEGEKGKGGKRKESGGRGDESIFEFDFMPGRRNFVAPEHVIIPGPSERKQSVRSTSAH